MKKFILLTAAAFLIGSSCYAVRDSKGYKERKRIGTSKETSWRKDTKWCPGLKNKEIWAVRKKMFQLKKYKWEAIRTNLKIEPKELANQISAEMRKLGLSSRTFDKLRKSAKNNWERIKINKLEIKFLKMQMMLNLMSEEGRLKWEKCRMETQEEAVE